MTTAVCELGPVTVRRLGCGTATAVDADRILGDAALDGGDGRTVLVGQEPRALPEVWRAVLQPLLDAADRAVLIHPSWWPVTRIETVRHAAGLTNVEIVTRADVLARRHVPGSAVVEIAEQVVAVVGGGAPIAVYARTTAPQVLADQVAAALARHDGRPVVVDAPPGVPGARALASLIVGRLAAHQVRAQVGTESQLQSAATLLTSTSDTAPAPGPTGAGRRRTAVTAGIAAVALTAGTSALWYTDRPASAPAAGALLDGRVSMDVPVGWTVQRVTDGPGSARVQVMSPSESESMLHLTQTWTPGTDLTAAAAALRQALDNETAGTFVDFNPRDTRADRAAVTYREVRPGREVLWVVLVDDGVRISVGCQNAYGRAASVAAACDAAVRSARRVR
jgi:type VII secretion-associated protein (TIGR03931 family)